VKVLMLWHYYPEYLSYFYLRHPEVQGKSFQEHLETLYDDHFGWPAGLCRYMRTQAIQALLLVGNDERLQRKWAQENGFRSFNSLNWQKAITAEQIRRFRPDVLWISSAFQYYGRFLQEVLPFVGRAICWISCPIPPRLELSGFYALVSSHPNIVKDIRHHFEKVVITKPGFDPSVLKALGPVQKRHGVSFLGSITPEHSRRAETLAYLLGKGVPLSLFGTLRGATFGEVLKEVAWQAVNQRSLAAVLRSLRRRTSYRRDAGAISRVLRPSVFGTDMFRELAASQLTLNIHIDVAGGHAGNIRLFEATGVGTCLLTEHADNIGELFEPGKELVTFRSREELLERLQWLLQHPQEAERIGRAGQARTLSSYTVERMFQDIRGLLE